MKLIIFLAVVCLQLSCLGQKPEVHPHCRNQEFDKEVTSLLSFSIPTIGCEEAKKRQADFVFLDARALKEYQTSHIPKAVWIDYGNLDEKKLSGLKKEQPLVVYCSVGYRSEKMAEKIKKLGFSNVVNLYGSIFEWVNLGYSIVNEQEKETKKLHTYNKKWSKFVYAPHIVKIW